MVMGPVRCMEDWVTLVWSDQKRLEREVHKGMTDVWMDGDEGSPTFQCFFLPLTLIPMSIYEAYMACQLTQAQVPG